MTTDTRKRAGLAAATLMITFGILAGPAANGAHAQLKGRRIDADVKRINDAVAAFYNIMSAAEKAIPGAVLDKAEAIAVFPRLPRIASRRGQGPITKRTARMLRADARGILSVRGEGGAWSTPAFLALTGGKTPLAADLVLVMVSQDGVEKALRHTFIIDEGAGVAPGPVGHDAQAPGGIGARAEIFSYARVRGELAGISLIGATLQQDMIANQRFYGKPLTTGSAVAQTIGPEPVALWRTTLEKHSR